MKLTIKTLTGGKFPIEVAEGSTVAAVKTIIETTNASFPADSLKLIHSGKVLVDDNVLSEVGIKENDFLVVMVAKKKQAAPPAATPKKEEEVKEEKPKEEEAKKEENKKEENAQPAETPPTAPAAAATPAPSTTASSTPGAPTQPSAVSAEVVQNLTTMGFPEEAVRHCLRVAQGNPDLAVEFLTNGIPEGAEQALQQAAAAQAHPSPSRATSASSGQPLQTLRNHPQFNDLRRVVQTNPQMLQQVLAQIGQQQPELLQEINANQALFLQMMNEPITESSTNTSGLSSSSPAPAGGGSSGSAPMGGDNPFAAGMGNPMQMAHMIQNMSDDEVNQMAQVMGISPEQLRMTAQMIGSMPPEQLNNFLMQAIGGGAGGGMEAMLGGAGGGPGGPQVLRLSDEEMAAVDRLTEMGFDRAEAAQAFLACDKNEALAANFLMDSMMNDDAGPSSGGGGGGGSGGGSGGNNNSNNEGGGGGDDEENMYD